MDGIRIRKLFHLLLLKNITLNSKHIANVAKAVNE